MMKQLHKQSSLNHRQDEEIPSNLSFPYFTKAPKHPRYLPRSINYLFKEQQLIFILIDIFIGSTFFIFQPTLSCLGPFDPNTAANSVSRTFSTVHDLVSKPTHAKVGRVPIALSQRRLRIAVTGGVGFVGSHLVDKIIDRSNDVIVIGRKDNLVHHFENPRFELIRHDVVEPILLEVDHIYHLACPASPIHYKYNPVKTIKTLFLWSDAEMQFQWNLERRLSAS